MSNVSLKVEGMSCNHCVQSIEKAVGKLFGVQSVKVSLADKNVQVDFNEDEVKEDKIKEAIEEQGYDVKA